MTDVFKMLYKYAGKGLYISQSTCGEVGLENPKRMKENSLGQRLMTNRSTDRGGDEDPKDRQTDPPTDFRH